MPPLPPLNTKITCELSVWTRRNFCMQLNTKKIGLATLADKFLTFGNRAYWRWYCCILLLNTISGAWWQRDYLTRTYVFEGGNVCSLPSPPFEGPLSLTNFPNKSLLQTKKFWGPFFQKFDGFLIFFENLTGLAGF